MSTLWKNKVFFFLETYAPEQLVLSLALSVPSSKTGINFNAAAEEAFRPFISVTGPILHTKTLNVR